MKGFIDKFIGVEFGRDALGDDGNQRNGHAIPSIDLLSGRPTSHEVQHTTLSRPLQAVSGGHGA